MIEACRIKNQLESKLEYSELVRVSMYRIKWNWEFVDNVHTYALSEFQVGWLSVLSAF